MWGYEWSGQDGRRRWRKRERRVVFLKPQLFGVGVEGVWGEESWEERGGSCVLEWKTKGTSYKRSDQNMSPRSFTCLLFTAMMQIKNKITIVLCPLCLVTGHVTCTQQRMSCTTDSWCIPPVSNPATTSWITGETKKCRKPVKEKNCASPDMATSTKAGPVDKVADIVSCIRLRRILFPMVVLILSLPWEIRC